ncbi:acyl-CoA thioesterase [Streptococcus dentasini]
MYSYTRKVHYYETDKMGIVHHSNYIRWMEEARIAFVNDLGYSYERLEAQQLISPVSELSCRYKNSTAFAQDIQIDTLIIKLNGVRCVFYYRMYRVEDGVLVFEGKTEHYFIDPLGQLVNIKRGFPEFYRALVDYQKSQDVHDLRA